MKSARELVQELTGIRLSATNTSLWSMVVTAQERALVAINDAIRVYEFNYKETFSSIPVETRVVAIPKEVKRVLNVNYIDPTSGRILPVPNISHVPTARTNLLYVNMTQAPSNTSYLEMEYEARLEEFPSDLLTLGPVSNTAVTITVPDLVSSKWPSSGYLELTDYSFGTSMRELVRYTSVDNSQFKGIVRGIDGESLNFLGVAKVSCVLPVDNKAVAVIMAAAEANMYNYWISNRAAYDYYTAAAGLGQADLSDIVTLVRISEEKAERRYRRIREAPSPGRARRR